MSLQTQVHEAPLELTRHRVAILATFVLSTILAIPVAGETSGFAAMIWLGIGFLIWGACLFLVQRDESSKLRRRLSVLLACTAILAICDIQTSLSNANFLQLGIPFAIVAFGPPLFFARTDPGLIRYRIWPGNFRKIDVVYTVLSIPLSWLVIKFYGWVNLELFNDQLFAHWTLSPEKDFAEIRRLFLGINMVGIWDELFFVNVVYAVLRSLFRYQIANAVQAVVYTAVLFDMAFTGAGVVIVYLFAWTQGSMFEKSESLLWVLIVHLIVDFFLVAAIVNFYYPGTGMGVLLRHGM